MATITEDYVSFETAKLLKEKGFDESISMVYMPYGDLCKLKRYDSIRNSNYNDITKNYFECTAPTLQMATKWLVQKHRLYVNVVPSVEGYYWTKKWHSYVQNLNKRYPFGKFVGTFNSPEEACEAAIKYCLEKKGFD